MRITAENIKKIRELKNLTQEYVAQKLRMSIANYCNIENAKTSISVERLKEIANVFDINCTQLLNLNFETSDIKRAGENLAESDTILQDLLEQSKIKDEIIFKLTVLLEKCGTQK